MMVSLHNTIKLACIFFLCTIGFQLETSSKKPVINGQGSTLAEPLYNAIIPPFSQEFPRALEVTYNQDPNQTGSTVGLNLLLQRKVIFAGSDVPPTNAQEKSADGKLLTFPTAIAGVSMAFNLPGNPTVTLNAQTIAKIFRGKITHWNEVDPSLPNILIIPVARSDSSGTTNIFTTFLFVASKKWPASLTGSGPFTFGNPQQVNADGSAGVATVIQNTTGALGYIGFDIATLNNLSSALVVNSSGNAIEPSVCSIAAAGTIRCVPFDLKINTINSPNPIAYPIANPTNIVVFRKQPSQRIAGSLRAFLDFIVSRQGQRIAAESDFGPLSPQIIDRYRQRVREIF